MKKFFALLFLLLFVFCYQNAYATNYPSQRIKRYVDRLPQRAEHNLTTLVRQITKPLDDNYDKAKAIAFWIAGHVTYDEYYYHDGKVTRLIKNYRGQSPNELLKSRVGICGDFAEMFKEMCKIAGIKAAVVKGYAYPATKRKPDLKRLQNSGHAWNVFMYHSKKIYVDTTFMADGRTGVNGRGSNIAHRRALHDIKKDNKYHNNVNSYDEYYFVFDYKDEITERNYVHTER